MSFLRYESYKKSDVEWLGDVPRHWNVVPIKSVATIINGYPFDSRLFDPAEGFPLIRIRDLGAAVPETFYKGDFVPVAAVTTDDVLIGMDGDFNVGRWRGEGAALLNQRVCCARGLSAPITRLLEYALPQPLKAINAITYSTTVKHLSSFQVEKIKIAVPPSEAELLTILSFLDRETAKIDALVDEQRRLIGLLKEKRQAVISHAVTKGLDPHAPMKGSGVEWLGQVPEHWQVGPLKRFVRPVKGAIKTGPFGSQLTSEEMREGEIKVYNQRNVIDGDFEGGDNFISRKKYESLSTFETFPGDVLVTTRGTIGRAAVAPSNAARGILHPCLIRVQPNPDKLQPHYLCALVQDSDVLRTQLALLSNATTIEVIYSDTMASLTVPVPPIEEQSKLLNFIVEESARMETLMADSQRAISLLQERRTALISAAVTGKIDVRGLSQTQAEAA